MRTKVCVALALLGTLCLTGVAANAQYYYPGYYYAGPAIALGIGQAPYAYLPPVYFQAPFVVQPLEYSQFQFYSRYNQYAYPSYYGDCYGC
jgi:hypothetical protein